MSTSSNNLRIGIAVAIIVGTIGWLAFTGYGSSKSYYVTIAELGGMRFPVSSTAFYHYVDKLGLQTKPFPNPLTPS